MSELSRQLRTEHFIKLTQKILDEPKNHYDVTLLIKNEDWHSIDRIIKYTDPRNVAVGSLVSLIRSTYHVRSKLCYWYDLVKNAREIMPLPDIILGIK